MSTIILEHWALTYPLVIELYNSIVHFCFALFRALPLFFEPVQDTYNFTKKIGGNRANVAVFVKFEFIFLFAIEQMKEMIYVIDRVYLISYYNQQEETEMKSPYLYCSRI